MLKEAVESRITIENFEPFEISWLLQYIYGLGKDTLLDQHQSQFIHGTKLS